MASDPAMRVLQILDVMVYAVGFAILFGGGAGGVAYVASGSGTRVLEAVFSAGLLLLFAGVILTRPKREELVGADDGDRDIDEPTSVQRRLAVVVPNQSPLPPSRQLSTGIRLLVAGGLLQIVSIAPNVLT